VKDTLQIGGGLFTNRSALRSATHFGQSKIDYYGITAAFHVGTPYEVVQRGKKKLAPFSWLNFGSTIALNYSLGVGNIVQAKVGYGDGIGELYREVPASVTAHEFVLTWASSITE